MNRIALLFFIGLIFLSNKGFSQNEFEIENIKKTLTEKINKILKETGIPSISISLVKGDTIIWSEAFGFANVKKQVPATSSTIYCVGSTFKFITATAIMQLQEKGLLKIDDPVNMYLGKDSINDLSEEGTPVTFRHLLSHHSGLKGSTEITLLWSRKLPQSLEEIASEISPVEPPGTKYEYCNHCYALAGLALEKITGLSFQEYIVENILKPLQIKTDGPVIPTPMMIEELALPYIFVDSQIVPENQYRVNTMPGGDIFLTCPDMANFYIAQLNQGIFKGKPILSPNSVAEMQKPQFNSEYGLGTYITINKKDSLKFISHDGGKPGYTTVFLAETNSKSAVYIAANAYVYDDTDSGLLGTLKSIAHPAIQLLYDFGNILYEGKYLYIEKEYDKAIIAFYEALKKDPENWEGHYYIARCYQEVQQYDKAILHFEQIIENYKKTKEFHWTVAWSYIKTGVIYNKTGETEKATEFFNKALSVPDNDGSHGQAKDFLNKNSNLKKNE
ncbi:MAG: DUF2225 domain-containing protein [Bacteroidota bacterium]